MEKMTNKTKSKPITFSAKMVNAILDNSKFMTRRVIKFEEVEDEQ
jgi:hypothetical protein